MHIFNISQLPGRHLLAQNGDEFLWCSGTDYLGMGYHDRFLKLLNEGLSRYGTHFGSSRNNSVRLNIYDEAEAAFSAFQSAEDTLLVSSGMFAGRLVISELNKIVAPDAQNRIRYHHAPKVHPAIWAETYRPNTTTWNYWAAKLVQEINQSEPGVSHIILTDAVGSPRVEYFNFSLFEEIQEKEKVFVVIDESHTLGVCGHSGNGIGEILSPKLKNQTIFLSSLNKALGIPAGVIWGPASFIAMLRDSPWARGASPPAPSYLYAFLNLLENNTYRSELDLLRSNIDHFRQNLLPNTLFQSLPEYPVFCSGAAGLFEFLLKNGIMASRFSYPLPTDVPVTRIVISSVHQKEDLNRLAEVCNLFIQNRDQS